MLGLVAEFKHLETKVFSQQTTRGCPDTSALLGREHRLRDGSSATLGD